MSRPWNIRRIPEGMSGLRSETYREAVARLATEDSNAYGQGKMSIAARIKNAVSLVSDLRTEAGSDMFMLSSYMAHALEDVYRMIDSIDIPDDAKIILANAVKEVEDTPSLFAQAKKLQQIEARRKHIEMAVARKTDMSKMESDSNGILKDRRSTDFTDIAMLVTNEGDDDEPA